MLPASIVIDHNNSKYIKSLPHVVVLSSSAQVERFKQSLEFFDSGRTCEVLPELDVSPYLGIEPRPTTSAERIRFFHRAQNAKADQVFLVAGSSLLQKGIPFKVLADHTRRLQKGDSLPEPISAYLDQLGYVAVAQVEDLGQYSLRGGILDLFSPAHANPVRIELFGDTIESFREFSADNQRSLKDLNELVITPAREVLYTDENHESAIALFRKSLESRDYDPLLADETLRSLARRQSFPGLDFCAPYFYKKLDGPLSHFSSAINLWIVDPLETVQQADATHEELVSESKSTHQIAINPAFDALYSKFDQIDWPDINATVEFSNVDLLENGPDAEEFQQISYPTFGLNDLSNNLGSFAAGSPEWEAALQNKLSAWHKDGYRIFLSLKSASQAERARIFLEKIEWSVQASAPQEELWDKWVSDLEGTKKSLHLIVKLLPESLRIPEEKIVFLRDEDLWGKKTRLRETQGSEAFQKKAKRLSFGELKPGDCIVHVQHGIGIYDGLKIMNIGGADSEFIQLSYKDKDRLYLPVYKVSQLQKFSGASSTTVLDKLGGPGWEKTKSKVKGHVRDLASELLALYAKRAEVTRPAFEIQQANLNSFESAFPYDETLDQKRAIDDLLKDLSSKTPMDRLICGDVGFGKTEVAMRAAFVVTQEKKQVAILAPTTILSFQHFETLKKRFANWNLNIRELNRFVTNADAKKTLNELKDGKVDIIVGTHRLLSKDVVFKDLGLLIIDEEQKFGVAHKEKIKKIKSSVDTLAMSATPIPRTLNMSLAGIRDLSLINTAPVDRLPTRTFVCKWDDETIRKGIENELARSGQVYFIHNRVQSIHEISAEIRKLVPQARIAVGHGQMPEDELEKVMISFFNHEIDVLICTTIVESGMDVSRANTMFIDQAHMMGLSQLYQLRGRVGRSKQRAYCYLMLPRGRTLDKIAQERLKVLQENTALGSGIRIAQYDLELRGAGNILGEDQSGHINSVGYEMYMDLLNEAVQSLKGEVPDGSDLDPEINLRIPALIPESYIGDIRLRLSYYKALADVSSPEDLEQIEDELKDQFGEIPEPTLNLMGLMLIRSECKKLGVQDIGAGVKNISLKFASTTKLKPETAIQLAMRENKKYSITPDNRLNIRMNSINWPGVYEELRYLNTLV